MYRDHAEDHTPREIRQLLVEYGGYTPTDLPMWRFVKAGDCTILCQGRVHHFPKGVEISIDDPTTLKPVRVTNGIATMPRYRNTDPEHWILQKWFPPSVWGRAFEWSNARAEENTPLFVDQFPVNGDYFMLAGPWRSVEEAGDLKAPIRMFLRAELAKRRESDDMIRQWMHEEQLERVQRLQWLEGEINRAQVAKAETLQAISSDAQKVRDLAAAQAGVDGFLGASEGWG